MWLFLSRVIAYLIWINCKNHCYQNRSINTFFSFYFHHFIALYNICFVTCNYVNIRAKNTRQNDFILFYLFKHSWLLLTITTHSINYVVHNCSVRTTNIYAAKTLHTKLCICYLLYILTLSHTIK